MRRTRAILRVEGSTGPQVDLRVGEDRYGHMQEKWDLGNGYKGLESYDSPTRPCNRLDNGLI